MKLTWHIFLKDVRHLRAPLALWALLLVAEVGCNVWMLSPAAADGAWFTRAMMFAALFAMANVVIMYLLAAALILADPLVGTRMFWVTRPISGGRLLGAKLLAILLLIGGLPVAIRLPFWLYCGFGPADLAQAALQSVAIGVCVALPAVVVAALVDHSGRFLLFSLALLVAVPVVSLLAVTSVAGVSEGVVLSRASAGLALAGLAGLVVVVRQFLTRRVLSSGIILGCGLAAAALASWLWPWRLDEMWPQDRSQLAGAGPAEVRLVRVHSYPNKRPTGPETTNVEFHVRLTGLPAERVALSAGGDIEFRWPDGTVIRDNRVGFGTRSAEFQPLRRALSLPAHREDAETVAHWAEVRQSRGLPPVEPPTLTGSDAPVWDLIGRTAVTPEVEARLASEPPACTIALRVAVGEPEPLIELPLQIGATAAGDGARMRLVDVDEERGRIEPFSDQPRRYLITTVVAVSAPGLRPQFVLLHRDQGGLNRFSGVVARFSGLPTVASIVRVADRSPFPRIWRNGRWTDVPGWPVGLTAAMVRHREVGGFDREIRVERLVLQNDRPSD